MNYGTCTYCGSDNLIPYLTIYKCLACNRLVRKPVIMPTAVTPVVEIE